MYIYIPTETDLGRICSPLKPAELAVLRQQYEKEGEMVGVQTKFNYAWVRNAPPLYFSQVDGACIFTYGLAPSLSIFISPLFGLLT